MSDDAEPLEKVVRVTPSTLRALKRARAGEMRLNDVIVDALGEYEPRHQDHTEPLEEA
jgi:hypothetical protein